MEEYELGVDRESSISFKEVVGQHAFLETWGSLLIYRRCKM